MAITRKFDEIISLLKVEKDSTLCELEKTENTHAGKYKNLQLRLGNIQELIFFVVQCQEKFSQLYSVKKIAYIPPHERTAQSGFRLPILLALLALGGEATKAQVLLEISRSNLIDLKPGDSVFMPSSDSVQYWKNAASWERVSMIRDGLLANNSRFGVWKITPLGRDYVNNRILS